ncbi:MAG TPA: hypothetical protein DC059_01055, partial [Dietzia sp.]|nr:hypothetical protein [Dietzia sp.]
MLGHGLGVGLVQTAQVTTDLEVEVGGLDVIGELRLVSSGRLACLLTGTTFRSTVVSGTATPPGSARGAGSASVSAVASISAAATADGGPPGTASP